ncbi:transporter substrate-binding domain-containing protein [Pseudoalteromonas sp. SMS1]|uniref:substrate-binding periplasmic protein n=1 Tax=Pseudoalteromonas sp. SMS1 TaxID=2908894 RepID=UPI001F35A747|nr:transporter substrate-binding domain-containing protein [Pseudoalteromonas sp. SMS1]MCF2857512.1 transporter substrate-binding domain-containing protein [Pseudoalteromonas sp. SMS1]
MVVRFENYAAQSRLDEETGWHGMDVDFAKALLDEAGCEYKFVSIPWGRSLKMLETGDIDLVLSVTKTQERQNYAYFIGPQRMETIVFAMNAQRRYTVDTMEDLFSLPVPVAIQQGAFYGAKFTDRYQQLKKHETQFIFVPDNQTKLSLLKHGRIAGFLEEKFNIIFQSDNHPDFMTIEIASLVINESPVYFAFSKRRTSMARLERLEAAYQNLQKTGQFQRILKKYQLQ